MRFYMTANILLQYNVCIHYLEIMANLRNSQECWVHFIKYFVVSQDGHSRK